MPINPSISLPLTTPGGMDAHVHTSPCPTVDDRVILGPMVMPMREFLTLVEHVLTSSPLRADDPRSAFVERIRQNATTTGFPGKNARIAILAAPVVDAA